MKEVIRKTAGILRRASGYNRKIFFTDKILLKKFLHSRADSRRKCQDHKTSRSLIKTMDGICFFTGLFTYLFRKTGRFRRHTDRLFTDTKETITV